MSKWSNLPSREEARAAFERHMHTSVPLILPAVLLLDVLQATQLALKHPQFPDETRQDLQRFLGFMAQYFEQVEPVFAALLRAGDTRDVQEPHPGGNN